MNKRRIFWTAATAAVLLAGWFVDPMGAATKTAAYLETTQTFTALKIFSGGLSVSSGNASLTTGQKLNLEGVAGDTYLTRNADTGCTEQYKDGALGWQLCGNRVIPPDCAAMVPAPEFGSICKDAISGNVLIRTGNGLGAIVTTPLTGSTVYP